ncbi:hypothetical protein EDD94_5448 [Streptomyces sp. PanSC9]|nr:hypothetical protein EDD94_5448 [Streptomyces sp. PanSC9]
MAGRPECGGSQSTGRSPGVGAWTSWSTTPASGRCLSCRLARGRLEPGHRRQPARCAARDRCRPAVHDRAPLWSHHQCRLYRRLPLGPPPASCTAPPSSPSARSPTGCARRHATRAELTQSGGADQMQVALRTALRDVGIDAQAIAEAIGHTIGPPEDVNVSEVIVQGTPRSDQTAGFAEHPVAVGCACIGRPVTWRGRAVIRGLLQPACVAWLPSGQASQSARGGHDPPGGPQHRWCGRQLCT